jgi:hypothetical protein
MIKDKNRSTFATWDGTGWKFFGAGVRINLVFEGYLVKYMAIDNNSSSLYIAGMCKQCGNDFCNENHFRNACTNADCSLHGEN